MRKRRHLRRAGLQVRAIMMRAALQVLVRSFKKTDGDVPVSRWGSKEGVRGKRSCRSGRRMILRASCTRAHVPAQHTCALSRKRTSSGGPTRRWAGWAGCVG
jgi:hypothetical protein